MPTIRENIQVSKIYSTAQFTGLHQSINHAEVYKPLQLKSSSVTRQWGVNKVSPKYLKSLDVVRLSWIIPLCDIHDS